MTVKITGLTANNVGALRQVLEPAEVTTTATTAVFHASDPIGLLEERMAPLPGRGHPRASLYAVLRKLRAKVPESEGQ